jgi:hypothetical protein
VLAGFLFAYGSAAIERSIVSPSERSSHVIPSERSESRDLHS